MRDTAGQLPHRFHLLGLQQRRLRLLSGVDLRPQPLIGGREFMRALRYHALKLLSIMRQGGGSGPERVADLVKFTYPATHLADRFAASECLGSGCQCLDRPPDCPGHPSSQDEAQREGGSPAAEDYRPRPAKRCVDKFPWDADRHGPAGHRRSPECGINGDAFTRYTGKPAALNRPSHGLPKARSNRLAEKAIGLVIARYDNAFAIEYSGNPIRRKILLFQQRCENF